MNTYQRQASLLKMMAHPMRLQILDILCSGNECVCHLSAALDKPQPYVSQQLAILRNAGVIADYRDGYNVFYRLADDATHKRVSAVLAGLGDGNSSVKTGRTVAAGCSCPKCSGGVAKTMVSSQGGRVSQSTS